MKLKGKKKAKKDSIKRKKNRQFFERVKRRKGGLT
jgi:hypothetical protein